ncbi:MAG: hypothetical protein N2559_12655 [Anaerolineae bacterium]|nr:hypothetical protein [Anaerolineae bacterium]
MSESVEKVIDRITFEIAQIDKLFDVYAELLSRVQQRQPDTVEIAAVASVLHSFYNGVENIFLVIAKHIDQNVPTGTQSHRDLLLQMTKRNRWRSNVISTETAQRLADYLGFRHFYRHSYSFFIDWNELQKLVHRLSAVWVQTKSEMVIFTNSLRPSGYAGNSLG